jgi:mono/diheme cytochrome c family protein
MLKNIQFPIIVFVATSFVAPTLLMARSNNNLVRRGDYLVNNIAGCGDCHSPRLADGAPDKAHWLQGSPLFFAPLHPVPGWTSKAPNIAGLHFWKADDIVKLLETGSLPNGARPNPPMPGYRMKAEDARAVVAYLKSLAGSSNATSIKK